MSESARQVAFRPGSELHLSSEIQSLLRGRLRIAVLIILGGEAAFFLHSAAFASPQGSSPIEFVFLGTVLLVQIGLAGLVWMRRPLSLRQLRACELLGWTVLGLYLASIQYRWFAGPDAVKYIDRGPEMVDSVSLVAWGWSLPWFAMIVVHGTFIPNTWQRCAVVTGIMAVSPLGLSLAAGLSNPRLPVTLLGEVLVEMVIWLALALATAVYGSHKVSLLRVEAFRARKLGHYQLKRLLGKGGMGEVYLAEHELLRRPCAVKLIRPDQAGQADTLVRFEREVRTMATLTHPNTIEVFDFGHTSDGTFYYVMEYLPGLSLQELVDRQGPQPAERVVHLLRQVCSALREAHGVGMVHRDIKPSNVMVCERGRIFDVVKLLDFGLVQLGGFEPAAGRLTTEGSILGTPLYMSPEQATGEGNVDARSDIYSLGAVAYWLLTGRPPFDHGNAMRVIAAHLRDPVPPPRQFQPDLPADVEQVVLRCLEKEPAHRYADADALEAALTACASGTAWTQARAAAWWRDHVRPIPVGTPDSPGVSYATAQPGASQSSTVRQGPR